MLGIFWQISYWKRYFIVAIKIISFFYQELISASRKRNKQYTLTRIKLGTIKWYNGVLLTRLKNFRSTLSRKKCLIKQNWGVMSQTKCKGTLVYRRSKEYIKNQSCCLYAISHFFSSIKEISFTSRTLAQNISGDLITKKIAKEARIANKKIPKLRNSFLMIFIDRKRPR
jgi:hypothetical protein